MVFLEDANKSVFVGSLLVSFLFFPVSVEIFRIFVLLS